MRFLRQALLGVVAVLLVTVALANRGTVTVRLLPQEIADMAGFAPSLEAPLFAVIIGGAVAGLVAGFAGEWLRQAGLRSTAARRTREAARLKAENIELKRQRHEDGDEVLALLEEVR